MLIADILVHVLIVLNFEPVRTLMKPSIADRFRFASVGCMANFSFLLLTNTNKMTLTLLRKACLFVN